MNHRRPSPPLAVVLLVGLAVACAAPIVWSAAQVAPQLASVAETPTRRSLAALDVTHDGRLGPEDAAALEGIAQAARNLLGDKAQALDPTQAFYPGPEKDAPGVLGLVAANSDGYDLSKVPETRLLELAVESRWAAAQARLAASAGLTPSDRPFAGALQDLVPGYNPETMSAAALCQSIDTFPLGQLENDDQAVAVFDMDSTLWDGNVTDGFLALLADRKVPRPEANAPLQTFLKTIKGVDAATVDKNDVGQNARILYDRATSTTLPEDERVSLKDSFYQIVSLLRGMSEAEAEAAGRAVFDEGSFAFPPWRERFFHASADGCGMPDLLAKLRSRGIAVYLLSATPDVLANLAADYFDVPRSQALGSALERNAGVFTGKVRDSTYYIKGSLIRQWLPAPPLFAFGDSSTSDFPMLIETAAAGFMINPKASFLERDQKEAGGRLISIAIPIPTGALGVGGGAGPVSRTKP